MWKPICHWHTQKEKTPSRSCYLRKGVFFFSAYGPSAIRQATCNGDDRRQWRKQGGAVGAAASRMRAAAKQTLGAATRAPLIRWAGRAASPVYHKLRQKDTIKATPPRSGNSPGAFHLPWLNFTPFGAAAPRGFSLFLRRNTQKACVDYTTFRGYNESNKTTHERSFLCRKT